MYPLTLTADERKAFDWVGWRILKRREDEFTAA